VGFLLFAAEKGSGTNSVRSGGAWASECNGWYPRTLIAVSGALGRHGSLALNLPAKAAKAAKFVDNAGHVNLRQSVLSLANAVLQHPRRRFMAARRPGLASHVLPRRPTRLHLWPPCLALKKGVRPRCRNGRGAETQSNPKLVREVGAFFSILPFSVILSPSNLRGLRK
jgi:hypothetical protein